MSSLVFCGFNVLKSLLLLLFDRFGDDIQALSKNFGLVNFAKVCYNKSNLPTYINNVIDYLINVLPPMSFLWHNWYTFIKVLLFIYDFLIGTNAYL